MTALTVYPTSTTATTVSTGRTLATTAPAAETSTTTKVAKGTGWGNLFPQGSTATWPAGASSPALGTGGAVFILDATTLEGQQLLAGTYTPKIKVSCSSAITMAILCHVGVRSSAGVYTAIGSAQTAATSFAAGTAQALTLPTISGAATDFAVGDKLVIDYDANVTVATSSTTATISLFMNGGTNESLVTPGFSPAAQTITATAVATAEVFGAATVTPGPIAVTPNGISTTEAFGAATVTASVPAQTISPTGIGTGEAIGSAALTPGPVTITAAGIISAETLGAAATVIAGPVTVTPAGIPTGGALGAATFTPGPVQVTPTGIASSITFGAAALTTGPVTISPGGITSGEAHGTGAVTPGPVTLTPVAISTGEGFGVALISGASGGQQVNPIGIGSLEVFPAPVLHAIVALTVIGIATGEQIGSPSVMTALTISPVGIATAEAFGGDTVTGGGQVVTPTGIGTASSGFPRVFYRLTPPGAGGSTPRAGQGKTARPYAGTTNQSGGSG